MYHPQSILRRDCNLLYGDTYVLKQHTTDKPPNNMTNEKAVYDISHALCLNDVLECLLLSGPCRDIITTLTHTPDTHTHTHTHTHKQREREREREREKERESETDTKRN